MPFLKGRGRYVWAVVGYTGYFLIAIVVVSGSPFLTDWQIRFGNPDASFAQKELMEFYSHLDLGMALTEVYNVFHERYYEHLMLEINRDRTSAIVWTYPYHFFAKGWILGIQLQDDKIVGLRIRIHDSSQRMPKTAPADRVAPEALPKPSWTPWLSAPG
jgi:hypothetical protein